MRQWLARHYRRPSSEDLIMLGAILFLCAFLALDELVPAVIAVAFLILAWTVFLRLPTLDDTEVQVASGHATHLLKPVIGANKTVRIRVKGKSHQRKLTHLLAWSVSFRVFPSCSYFSLRFLG